MGGFEKSIQSVGFWFVPSLVFLELSGVGFKEVRWVTQDSFGSIVYSEVLGSPIGHLEISRGLLGIKSEEKV